MASFTVQYTVLSTVHFFILSSVLYISPNCLLYCKVYSVLYSSVCCTVLVLHRMYCTKYYIVLTVILHCIDRDTLSAVIDYIMLHFALPNSAHCTSIHYTTMWFGILFFIMLSAVIYSKGFFPQNLLYFKSSLAFRLSISMLSKWRAHIHAFMSYVHIMTAYF